MSSLYCITAIMFYASSLFSSFSFPFLHCCSCFILIVLYIAPCNCFALCIFYVFFVLFALCFFNVFTLHYLTLWNTYTPRIQKSRNSHSVCVRACVLWLAYEWTLFWSKCDLAVDTKWVGNNCNYHTYGRYQADGGQAATKMYSISMWGLSLGNCWQT